MPRVLSTPIKDHLIGKKIRPFYCVAAEFEEGMVYFTNAARNITFGGNTYFATGNWLAFDGLEETLKLEGASTNVKLSGITDTIKSLVLNQEYSGNPLKIYLGFFDDEGDVIDTPTLAYEGKMDGARFTDDFESGTAEINIPVVSQWARFEDKKGRKSNPSEQKYLYPGDTVFDNVPGLTDKVIQY